MKKFKDLLFYLVTIGGLSGLIYFVVFQGNKLQRHSADEFPLETGSAWDQFVESLRMNLTHPLGILLLQIITIILVARFFGYFFRRIGQPSVIGEIVAGILLGPSLLGAYFPEISAFLFPPSSLGNLGVMSQIGLILFMFVVGMELDLEILKKKAHEAVVVSHASIIFPFALGVILAYFIYQETAPEGIGFSSYALFIGISMSITAFPVLARIVQERGMTKTRLGALVITCAAADDITAWCILAAVIAIVKAGSVAGAGYTILLAVLYVFLMLKLVRPFLQRVGNLYTNKEGLSKPIVGVFFVTLVISAWCTEVIGIHALFGAFMAGVVMPPNINFRNIFVEKVEDIALVLLLPLFFVFTGLRTQIGLLSEPGLWQLCLIIIAVAVAGKFFGSALTARFVGQSWRDSLSIGALMNTRGLMELVALNIGYDLGVLSPEMFAILVLMALITTFMTGPVLDLINKVFGEEQENESLLTQRDKYNVLISFGNPQSGQVLVRLAHVLIRKSRENTTVTALHLSPGNELNQFNFVEYERESFRLIREEAASLQQPFKAIFKPVQDIDAEITEIANGGDYDLLLVGIGQSVFEGTLLGKILGFTSRVINPERLYDTITGRDNMFTTGFFDERTRHILKSTRIPTGILIDKSLKSINKVIVPVLSAGDNFLISYIQKLIHNGNVSVTILEAGDSIRESVEFKEALRSIEIAAPGYLTVRDDKHTNKALFAAHDLMLISLESWKRAIDTRSVWLSDSPSVMILKP